MVKSDKMVRDNQHLHWEKVFAEDGELFGNEPSFAAKQAAELLKKERKTKILELGAGQGRDTIFFRPMRFSCHGPGIYRYWRANHPGKSQNVGLNA